MDSLEKTIYVPLVGEGTQCWRPVRALTVGGDIFKITEEIPEGETRAYSAFSRVRCENKVFADGQTDLVVIAYAVESNPYYRLLKDHRGEVFSIVLADGESALVKVAHVDEEHEDFICDVISTNLEQKYAEMPDNAVFAIKFADLVSMRLEQ